MVTKFSWIVDLNLYIMIFLFRNTVGGWSGVTFLSGTSHPVSV